MTSVPRKSGTGKKSKGAERRKKSRRSLLVKFLIAAVYVAVWAGLMFVAVKIDGNNKVVCGGEEHTGNIPVMRISLNGVTLDEVHENGKDVKYSGNFLTIGDESYENVEFKGRGNFSWAVDKKSYRIKFTDKEDLLGMGKAKKWALIANDVDDTSMRNDLAYYIAQKLIGEFQVRGEFVDLVIDGENLGVYYLIKTMEINKRTIDLRDAMGVLVELDNVYCGAEDRRYIAKNGDCFTVKDIVTEDNEKAVMEDFVKQYNDFLNALEKKDYETMGGLVDIESFAKYFIISELTANPDAYVTSWFLYKDGFDDEIHAGLAWDFDAAFGNRNWGDWPNEFYSPTAFLNRLEYTYEKKEVDRICSYDKNRALKETVDVSLTMCQFLDVPEFREMVGNVYREKIVGKENEIIDYISARANILREAARRDAALWEKGDFDEEVEYLKWWMRERLKYFEETYAGYFVESKTT